MKSSLLLMTLVIWNERAASTFIDKTTKKSSLRSAKDWNRKMLGPSENGSSPHKKIVHSEEAEVGRYPYMVSLLEEDIPLCEGTLVHPEWVLSAAYCAKHATHVRIGHNDLNDFPESSEKIQVDYTLSHSDHVLSIIMIKLKTPSSFQVAQTYKESEPIPEGTQVTTIGWGTTAHYASAPDVLREVGLRTASSAICPDVYGYLGPEASICTAADGKEPCFGNVGGPLLIKGSDASSDVQVGISIDDVCDYSDDPGVYASLVGTEDFIKCAIENSTGLPDDCYDYTESSLEMKTTEMLDSFGEVGWILFVIFFFALGSVLLRVVPMLFFAVRSTVHIAFSHKGLFRPTRLLLICFHFAPERTQNYIHFSLVLAVLVRMVVLVVVCFSGEDYTTTYGESNGKDSENQDDRIEII